MIQRHPSKNRSVAGSKRRCSVKNIQMDVSGVGVNSERTGWLSVAQLSCYIAHFSTCGANCSSKTVLYMSREGFSMRNASILTVTLHGILTLLENP